MMRLWDRFWRNVRQSGALKQAEKAAQGRKRWSDDAAPSALPLTERFGVKFPLRLLFEQPTVAALAIAVEEMLLEQLAVLEQEVHAWPRLESTPER